MYQVYCGYYGPDTPSGARHNSYHSSWGEARVALEEQLHKFDNDACKCCREAAGHALIRLSSADCGLFEDEVDGAYYMIVPLEQQEYEKAYEKAWMRGEALAFSEDGLDGPEDGLDGPRPSVSHGHGHK